MATTGKTSAKATATPKGKAGVSKKASAVPGKTAPKTSTPVPSTEFIVYAPEATEVILTGEFCDWLGEGYRMRRFKDGNWKKSLKLKPGRYEYRFIVDGHWWTDPENPHRQENHFGQDNSVLIIP